MEYDFTDTEQGKFYRPPDELENPIYQDKGAREIFFKNIRGRHSIFSFNKIVNSLIRQDIEISKKLLPEQTA